MPERSAWRVLVSIPSRPGPLWRTRQRRARRGSVPLGKLRIYILLHKVWMYAQDVKHDEPRQAHRPGNARIEGHRHPGIEFVAALDGRGQDGRRKRNQRRRQQKKKVSQVKTAVAIAHPCEHRAMIEPDNSGVTK